MQAEGTLAPHLRAALEQGGTVLTANERSAEELRRVPHLSSPSSVLPLTPASILSWNAWLSSQWHQLLLSGHAHQVLLNRTQEHALWLEVLDGDSSLATIRSRDSLADLAAEAYRTASAWRAQTALRHAPGNPDTLLFRRWAASFDALAASREWLPQASLEARLLTFVIQGQLTCTGPLLLHGFDSFTPAQSALIDALRNSGCNISIPAPSPPSAAILIQALDEVDEIRTAARWADDFLRHYPLARIAIIVPDLEQQRTLIDRELRRTFTPSRNLSHTTLSRPSFEFSLGLPLARTQLATTALDLLHWAAGALPLNRVSALLLSPVFAAPSRFDLNARAIFDVDVLRRRASLLRPEMTLSQFHHLLHRRSQEAALGSLENTIQRMIALEGTAFQPSRLNTFAHWSESCRHWLDTAQCHADSTPGTYDFQVRRKWESALDELSTLDLKGALVSFSAALSALDRISANTIFAPQSRQAPVQVLGPLEAAGCSFDAIWFMRAGDLQWPVTRRPNPLLPWQLQRDLGMPGADLARDHTLQQQITLRITSSAPSVTFSYARQAVDAQLHPSPLLSGLTSSPIPSQTFLPAPPEGTPLPLETIPDDGPIPPPPDQTFPHGASVLLLQASCAFRAFAELRLASTAPEDFTLGFDPADRGSLVHKALELFWAQVKSQSALRQLSFQERQTILNSCIQQSLERASSRQSTPWDLSYLAAQHRSLFVLLSHWLDKELQRAPFEVIQHEKNLQDVKVGPLRLNLRLDRVDDVGGFHVLIDYKTGVARPSQWLSPRPEAPQLPLYSIIYPPQQLGGVMFAQLRPGDDMSFSGFSISDDIFKSEKMEAPDLPSQVDLWRHHLTRLAEEFSRGDASISPRKFPGTCSHCGQRLLCRLDPASLDPVDTADSDQNSDDGSGPASYEDLR